MKSNKLGIIFALIAICSGIWVIFTIVPDTEVAVGFVTLTFGVLAIIWTVTAQKSLSPGSTLKKHIDYFLGCLILIILFTIWHTISKVMHWRTTVNEVMMYPGYALLTLAFLVIVFTSYQIQKMSQEFGFESQAQKIQEIIEAKKERSKKSPLKKRRS